MSSWSTKLLICVAAAILTTVFAADECSSGILQMKPLPQDPNDPCFSSSSGNNFQAGCISALRVRVKDGIVKLVPLVLVYNYSNAGSVECNVYNASGLFYPGSTASAGMMMRGDLDYGGPFLSNLTKTATDQITLTPATSDPPLGNGRTNVCVYNYTVVQGCVFGVKAPPKPATTCPPGYTKKAGRFGVTYCALCNGGTYYDKATAACKPCPIGTYSSTFGATQCTKCNITAGYYASKPGLFQCDVCSTNNGYYTDGKSCTACPKGSFSSYDIPGRCFRCDAGKKCCTVGWGKGCPKCGSGAAPKKYTSMLALEDAAPSSCLATGHALCAPKIEITAYPDCSISLETTTKRDCSWRTIVPVTGARLSIKDIAKFDSYPEGSLLAGNFTSAASPYLTVNIPETKCTLRYRALTSAFASLLGVAPKPSKATSCPAGQYPETDTDAKPGPCLRCPPGTYSPKPSTGNKCSPCPAGTYANRYGSTKCKRCPSGQASPRPGASECNPCEYPTISYALPSGKGCRSCPKDSEIAFTGGRCLGNMHGSVCCAAVSCSGQPPCKGPLPPRSSDEYTAVMQLVSKSVAQPACRNATLLSCLPASIQLRLSSGPASPASLGVEPHRPAPACLGDYSGGYIGATAAYVSSFNNVTNVTVTYGLLSDKTKGTVTMFLSADNFDVLRAPAKAPSACTATFKIVSGYAFDLTPPKGAKCDGKDAEFTYGGRKFCRPCDAGQYKTRAGTCADCPAGTYSSAEGSVACKPCRAGYSCGQGAMEETMCGEPWNVGTHSSKPRQTECSKCPKNTRALYTPGRPTTTCEACPMGTIAPEGATGCGVPWDEVFPA